MRHVFLAGALAQEAVLREVTGAEAQGVMQPASLEGAALWQEDGPLGCFPRLYPEECARGAGVLLSLEGESAELFDRLSYLAEAIGMVPVPKHVM